MLLNNKQTKKSQLVLIFFCIFPKPFGWSFLLFFFRGTFHVEIGEGLLFFYF